MKPSCCAPARAARVAALLACTVLGLGSAVILVAADPPAAASPVTNLVDALIQRAGTRTFDRISGRNPILVFRQNKVEVTGGSGTARNATNGQELVGGDLLRTFNQAQALVRGLSTLWGVDGNSRVRVRPDGNVTNLQGAFYFKTLATPGEPALQLGTPGGTIKKLGTEFFLEVDETTGETRVWVRDGELTLSNADGSLTLTTPPEGQALDSRSYGVMRPNQAPTNEPPGVLTFNRVIQWILYYPAILDLSELPAGLNEDESLRPSLDAYQAGDLVAAQEKYPYPLSPGEGPPRSAADRLYRAALLTSIGRIDEVEQLLAPLLEPAPTGPDGDRVRRLALAFRLMHQAVRNETTDQALPRAPAIDATPPLATELLARSYYLQSRSDEPDNIGQALAAALGATRTQPQCGLAWARVADLEFSRGHTARARAALARAQILLSLDNASLLTLEGYLHAADGRLDAALQSFERAVAKNGRLGDAWLGLGLCLIRQGKIEAGLEFLQIAMAREPQRATMKSYLAKGYEVAGRPQAALEELASAQRADPNDPTPWLYSALIKRDQNRVNDAIHDLERSKELNDNRMIFRSRSLLDQDRAVRSANLAGLYRDAGMTDVSVREATRAVTSDYGNSSAHLFLASSYDALRDPAQITLRYETPWLNELLIAQMLQPVGAGSLSQTVSQQEYSRLFQQDGPGLFSRTEYRSNGDWVESASQYGSFGTTDYAVDAHYLKRNGERVNDDLEGLTLWGKIKQQITPNDTILLQALYYDSDGGDLRQLYDQSQPLTDFRVTETQEPTLLAGYHHRWSPEHQTLFLAGWVNDTIEATDQEASQLIFLRDRQGGLLPNTDPVGFTHDYDYESTFNLFSGELQHIWQLERFTTIGGVRYQYGQFDTSTRLDDPRGIPFFPPILFTDPLANQDIDSDFQRFSAYAYEHWEATRWLTLVAGVAYDWVEYPLNHRLSPISAAEDRTDQISPKVGLIVTPAQDTTLRASYTRSLGGLSLDQSFRLEPTQVAGFVQSYRSLIPESEVGSVPVPDFETAGVMLDHRFPTRTYAAIGAEWLTSSATQSGGAFDSYFAQPIVPATLQNDLDYREQSLLATANQLLGSVWSIGVRYRLSLTELDQQIDNPLLVSGETEATLHSLDGFLLLNLPCGFFSEFQALWRSQDNDGYSPARPGDSFAQFNLFAGYRFLRRHGEVRVGLLNLTDEDYQLNPLSFYAELPRERMFYASLKLDF